MTASENTFLKKYTRHIAYGAFAVLTAILFIALIIWSALGAKGGEVIIHEVPLVLSEEVQTEYLVGQKFNPDGISLNIGSEKKPDLVSASECAIEANFTSGGHKRVAITYSPNDYTSYVGYLDTTVYFVRGIKVVTPPTDVTVNEDGTFTCDEDFNIVAYLNEQPEDTDIFAAEADGSIRLTPDMYTARAVESKQVAGFYTASVYCGNLTYNFNFFNGAGKTFMVAAERNVIPFENVDETSNAGLTLVVTDAPDTYQHESVGQTEGYYIYTSETGAQYVYPFSYELTETKEIFSSENFKETHSGDSYTVSYSGKTFTVSANVWQSGVVNGEIVQDGNFLFVVETQQRIVEFDYLGTATGQAPTLKVYVTYYYFNMSTGSGVSTGFYLFTDRDGTKYKLPFYFQTWVWDYVPLSFQHGDGRYPNCYVDLDWMYPQYTGDVNTRIKIGNRSEEFKVAFGDIRYAAYNTN